MKPAFKGDDLVRAIPMPCAKLARELDRALIRFRTRIGEEHLIEATLIYQRLCQLQARRVEKGRARRKQQFRLFGQRFSDDRWGVPEAIDRPALHEIEVALAGVVPQK